MCDTFVLRDGSAVWFGKNSDRPPGEVQLIDHVAAGGRSSPATWIDITTAPPVSEVILSRPAWMWGAEIGVNSRGVAIGNEAVYTRFVKRRGNLLLGMDLLRLALEQATSAPDAVDVIVEFLERIGQGGAAAEHNPRFRYDNSFLIADTSSAWILETAGRWWAARKVERFAAISNDLTLETEFDRHAAGMQDFARRKGLWRRGEFSFRRAFGRRFMPWAARSRQRRECSLSHLSRLASHSENITFSSLIRILRHHHRGDRPSSNADICMHSRGALRPSETTSSLIARLTHNERPQILATGSSLPCLSVFKPVSWTGDDFLNTHKGFWTAWNQLIRDPRQHSRLRRLIDRCEPQILQAAAVGDTAKADRALSHWWESVQSSHDPTTRSQ